MDETVRRVAWAIAEAWWRKRNRVAAGTVPEATSAADYADNFWQSFAEEAGAAIAAMGRRADDRDLPLSASVARI